MKLLNKIQLIILLLVIAFQPILVSAADITLIDTYWLNSTDANLRPQGIITNGSDANPAFFWVVDDFWDVIWTFNSTFQNQSSKYTNDIYIITGLGSEITTNNSNFYLIGGTSAVYHLNSTFDNQEDGFLIGANTADHGFTMNSTHFFAMEPNYGDGRIRIYNESGNVVDYINCEVNAYCQYAQGLTTIDGISFWLLTSTNGGLDGFIYQLNTSGMIVSSRNITSLGKVQSSIINSLTTSDNNNFWITNMNTKEVYHISYQSAPSINIISPSDYLNSSDIGLDIKYNINDNGGTIDKCWYSNNTMATNTTLTSCENITTVVWGEGEHNVTIWINNTIGDESYDEIIFSIDTIAPLLNITYPLNLTNTTNTTISINYTRSDNGTGLNTCWYSNNSGTTNITLSNCINITGVTWIEGFNNITIWANDSTNNVNFSYLVFKVDTTAPSLSIVKPTNGESTTSNSIDFKYLVSDVSGAGLDKCWYQNNTGSNITIACGTNTTISQAVDGTYTIYVWANDTLGNLATDYHTWTISSNAPAINLEQPTSNEYFNRNSNIDFNFSVLDANGIDTCKLWTNTTGTWELNQTLTTIINNSYNNFTSLNIQDGYYIWNVWCNDSTGIPGTDSWGTLNKTFTIDTVYPIVNFTTTNMTTFSSMSATLSFNITESYKNTCTFVLTNNTGDTHNYAANTSIPCSGSSISISTLEYGTFHLRLWVTDKSGNVNKSDISFVTQAPPSGDVGGGGGGVTVVIGNLSWSMSTETSGDKYQFNMLKGSSREKDLLFENLGVEDINITLSCEYVSGSSNICDFIEYDTSTFYLPVEKEIKIPITFRVNIPEDYEKGDYIVNLVATDSYGNIAIITTEVNVESFSIFVKLSTKLTISKKIGDINIPYILIFFVLIVLFSVIFSYIYRKSKFSASGGLGVITGLFLSFIALIFI